MKRFSPIVLIIPVMLQFAIVQGQENRRTITGQVTTYEESQPLEGATVSVKAGKLTTGTQPDGIYYITISEKDSILVFTYSGYTKVEIRLSASNEYNVVLRRLDKELSEVVVVGYNSQSKKSITGATGNLKGSSLKDVPVAGFNQLLQGKTTGVQVTSNSGVPGGGIFIRVRGTNSVNADNEPLYVLDGVFINNRNLVTVGMGNQVQSNPLADLNPEDIETIQILKDANATAIYGSRGANGVILITTKRGKSNSKSKTSFSTYQGWADAAKKYKVTTGPETAVLENELFINNGGNPALVPFRPVSTGGQGTPEEQPTYDRINDLFRTARTSNYEVSLAGGKERTNFYLGLGYFRQQSIVQPSEFERYSGRFNFDHAIDKKFRVGTSTTIARTRRNVSSNDNNPAGVINSALFPRSYLPVFNSDGTYAKYGNFDNHLALIRELDNDAAGWRIISNLYGEYNFFPGLRLRTSWSFDFNDLYENNFNNTLLLAGQPRGNASSILSRDLTLINEQVLSYSKEIGTDHSINALIGNTIQQNTFQRTQLNGQQFPNNSLTTIASSATQTGTSSKSEARLVSFFGKAGYNYRNKLFIDGSLRADASSRFGKNKQWGYFPAVGVAWLLNEESFLKNLDVFNQLKLRASYGLTGNQSGISDFASLGLWQGGSNYLDLPGTAPFQLANPDLSWETTRQLNLGVDFSILRNRLNVEINYYHKYTYDLLLNVPVPRRSGYSSIVQNYGAVSNKGFELSLNSSNIETKDFRWTTDFHISTNKNKIEKLAAPITTGSRDIFRLEEGQSLYSFWLYKQLLVDPQTGDAIYEDLNKDGIITVADRQIVGDAWPDFQGGLTNNFTYKNFDLGIFFYFEKGAEIINMNRFFLVHGGVQRNIGYFPEQLERWQKAGDITDIPRLTTSATSNNYGGSVQNLSTRYLEDGSFIRLRTVSLGYNLSPAIINRIGISSVRLYVVGTNLWTGTNYSGLDPEVNSQSGVANTKNFDWATVPQPRSIQVGASITF